MDIVSVSLDITPSAPSAVSLCTSCMAIWKISLRYWHGNGLAIRRIWVGFLAGHHCVVAFARYLHLCASVTNQYNLVPAKGVISLTGKVIVGLVESNSSLPPSL